MTTPTTTTTTTTTVMRDAPKDRVTLGPLDDDRAIEAAIASQAAGVHHPRGRFFSVSPAMRAPATEHWDRSVPCDGAVCPCVWARRNYVASLCQAVRDAHDVLRREDESDEADLLRMRRAGDGPSPGVIAYVARNKRDRMKERDRLGTRAWRDDAARRALDRDPKVAACGLRDLERVASPHGLAASTWGAV